MPKKTVTYANTIYKLDNATNSYLYDNKDGTHDLLVYLSREDNWEGYTNADIISRADDSGFDGEIETYEIIYEYYKNGIQYIEFDDCRNDAGDSYLAFDVKLYLQIYEPKLFKKINSIKSDFKGKLVWRDGDSKDSDSD